MILKIFKPNLVVAITGVIVGVTLQLNWLATYSKIGAVSEAEFWGRILLGGLLTPFIFYGFHRLTLFAICRMRLHRETQIKYKAWDAASYLVFLVFILGAVGIQFGDFMTAALLAAFVAIKGLALAGLISKNFRDKVLLSNVWLMGAFFVSGFAARVYQVAWQRALYLAYGVNIESVTVIVSIFMFGLGVGSLFGGILSKRWEEKLPELFMICEFTIGGFGIASLAIIRVMSYYTLSGSLIEVSLATYGILLLPTLMMGATLPILVAYINKVYKSVGKSVGVLYFVNTVGSAIACFAVADFLFPLFGLAGTVYTAALLNFMVGFIVYGFIRGLKNE